MTFKFFQAICHSFLESKYGRKLLERSADLSSDIRSTSVQKSLFNRYSREFIILIERCLLIFWREYKITSPSTLSFFLVATIIGVVYYDLNLDQIGIMNITGGIFIVLTFISITPVIDVVYVSL